MAGKRVGRGIRRIASRRYELRATVEGRAFSTTIQAASDSEARKAYHRWRGKVEDKAHLEGSGTLGAFLRDWLDHKRVRGLEQTTLSQYKGYIQRYIDPRIGARQIPRLTTRDLDKLYQALEGDGVGVSIIRKVHLVLHGSLEQAVRWNLILANPATHAQPPIYRIPDAAERTPTANEVARLYLEAFRTSLDFALYIWLSSATGARRGEMNGLRWSDIDFDESDLMIRRGIVHGVDGLTVNPTKTHQQRRVDLDLATVTLLREHRLRAAEYSIRCGAPLQNDAYVFSSRPDGSRPLRPDSMSQHFARLTKRIGLSHLTLHGLRHFHISELFDLGVIDVNVSKRVGHSRTSITKDVYGHARPTRDREAALMIGEVLVEALDRARADDSFTDDARPGADPVDKLG